MSNKLAFIVAFLFFIPYLSASQAGTVDKRLANQESDERQKNKKIKKNDGSAAQVKQDVDQAVENESDKPFDRTGILTHQHETVQIDIISFQNFSRGMVDAIEIALKDSSQVKSFQRHFNKIKQGYSMHYDAFLPVRMVDGKPTVHTYTDNIDECAQQFDAAVAKHQTEHNEKTVAGEKLKIALTEYDAYLSRFVSDAFHEVQDQNAKKADEDETWSVSPALLPAVVKTKHMPVMLWSAKTAEALIKKHSAVAVSSAMADSVIEASYYGKRRVAFGDIQLADFGQLAAQAAHDDHDVECALFGDRAVRFLVKKKAYGNLVICNAAEIALFDDLYKAYHNKQDEHVVQLLAQCDAKVRNPILRANLKTNYEFEKTAQRVAELRKRVQVAAAIATTQGVDAEAATAAASKK
jgi:hypothetical protein